MAFMEGVLCLMFCESRAVMRTAARYSGKVN